MCCTRSTAHATFLAALKAGGRGGTETAAWSLSLCHFAPACRCLQVMERALGNIYILNPLYRPCPCRSGARSRGGIGGERAALSAHADMEGGSSTHSSAVSLELFMVIVLSAFLSLPREAGAQGG